MTIDTMVEKRESPRWRTGAELAQERPGGVPWVIPGFLAQECITELSGQTKAGKTTLVGAMVRSVLLGHSFLGVDVSLLGPVLYMTEEREATFCVFLDRWSLRRSDLSYMTKERAWGKSWEEMVEWSEVEGQRVGAVLLVVDTLSDWAGLSEDAENKSGAAMEAMRPLQKAAESGLAVLVLRHDRKSGGELGQSGRGSSAFSGSADIVFQLLDQRHNGHPSRRLLKGVGRLTGVPKELVIELQGGEYVCEGTTQDVDRMKARTLVLSTIPNAPPGLTHLDLLHAGEPWLSRATLLRALSELEGEGLLMQALGSGQKGTAKGVWHT